MPSTLPPAGTVTQVTGGDVGDIVVVLGGIGAGLGAFASRVEQDVVLPGGNIGEVVVAVARPSWPGTEGDAFGGGVNADAGGRVARPASVTEPDNEPSVGEALAAGTGPAGTLSATRASATRPAAANAPALPRPPKTVVRLTNLGDLIPSGYLSQPGPLLEHVHVPPRRRRLRIASCPGHPTVNAKLVAGLGAARMARRLTGARSCPPLKEMRKAGVPPAGPGGENGAATGRNGAATRYSTVQVVPERSKPARSPGPCGRPRPPIGPGPKSRSRAVGRT